MRTSLLRPGPPVGRSSALLALLGALVLLPLASPAAAASGITSPGAGEVVAADAVVPLRAVVEGPVLRPSELSLRAPGARASQVVAVSTSRSGGELAYDFDTACAAQVCPEPVPARNGTWLVELSGAAQDAREFVLRIPPATPQVLDAAAGDEDAGSSVVRWRLGAEPDLVGYAVERPDGTVVRARVELDACDADGTCSAQVPGTDGAWTVRAFRATCPDCAELLASEASAPVGRDGPVDPVQALGGATEEPAAAAPSSAPAQAGAPRAAVPDQRGAFTRSFGSGRVATVEVPSLGPPPAATAPVPDGSYDTTLGYTAPDVAAPSRASEAVEQALSGNRLSLLLLGAGLVAVSVWMRRWARRSIEE